jgi:heme exporter protein D
MSHMLYVASAYGISALVLGGLVGWLVVDQRGRRRDLAEMEAKGVRRRSAREIAR